MNITFVTVCKYKDIVFMTWLNLFKAKRPPNVNNFVIRFKCSPT